MRIDFTQPWTIQIPAQASPTLELAARELHDFLQTITGSSVAITPETSGGRIFELKLDPQLDAEYDGFTRQVAPNRIILSGASPRALLYAVYDFLEQLGVVFTGLRHTCFPRGTAFDVEDTAQSASFPERCLILGHHAFLQDGEDWIIWAARSRINTIFFHTIVDPLPLGAAPESQYLRLRGTLIPLARERGMTIEHGGHKLAQLLPRNLFRAHSEAFREHEGKRVPDHNLCPSSEFAIRTVQEHARAHFLSHPEVDVFHIWADDIPGGGWCECPQCQSLTPSEQSLRVTNALAEVLEKINPRAQISFLAYHDTESVPSTTAPRGNVCLLWAPRMRCYAHSLTGDCAVNTPHYPQTYQAQAAHFQSASGAPPRVFEYYLDAVLFKSVLPPLTHLMQSDLRHYLAAGTHCVQALMTGDAPWVMPPLNAWSFTKLSWNVDADPEHLTHRFYQAFPGSGADAAARYARIMEDAFSLALELTPEQIRLSQDLNLSGLTIDMGDPYFADADHLRKRLARAETIPALLQQARSALDEVKQTAPKDAMRPLEAEFELHAAWLRYDLARLRIYHQIHTHADRAALKRSFSEARGALRDVLAWADARISGRRHRANVKLIHQVFWGRNLDLLAAKYLAPRVLKPFFWLRGLLRLIRPLLGVFRRYH